MNDTAGETVTASDPAGNSYRLAQTIKNTDDSGWRLSLLQALDIRPLPAGSSITLTFSGTTDYVVVAELFSGPRVFDAAGGAFGKVAAFASAPVAASAAPSLLVGAVSVHASPPPALTWEAGGRRYRR